MPIRRTFLGWSRPLCETVPGYLLAGADAGMLDLRGTVVVVPTRESSWRLRAALPLAADAQGAALLGPEIVTPPVLIEPPPVAAVATGFQSLLAWSAVLNAVKPGELTAFLGNRPAQTHGGAWAIQLARRLQELRKELADGGLSIAAVAARDADIEEGERWAAMADLERRYAAQLKSWRFRDVISLKLDHAGSGVLAPEVRRVIVAAVPDPPRLFMNLLERWAATGGSVEVLVAAPEAEGDSFDAWGRPLPDAWQKRAIAVPPESIWLEATPSDQASRIAEAIKSDAKAERTGATMRPRLAIGVPDRETVAPLLREMAAIGLPAFDPQNRPFAETALFMLVQALLALRSRTGYAEAAALLRHPDILACFGHGVDLLRALDTFQSGHLPVTLDDMLAAPSPVHEALVRIQEWEKTLNGGDLAAGLRLVLREVYKGRLLKSDNPSDSAFQQDVSVFDAGLRELEGAGAGGYAGENAAEVLMARLQDATVKAERRDELLDLEGWLELAWNPAPLLFVAGMNEGFVPDGHVGDLFLPDTLRRQLDLRDDRLRAARDAYVLTALIEQRRNKGQVILLVGKTSTVGDPLRPSRLLFRCPDPELVARARMLFRDPLPAHTAEAFTISFKLDPSLLPKDCLNDKRSREMSPTIFREYLACPLRFYLKHVLGMEPLDDRARELDALAFGTLVHDVLSEMGQDKQIRTCGDAARLAGWLENRLRALARAQYGARPWLGVEVALDSAVQRLRAFAPKHVERHAEGWDIIQCEETKRCTIEGVLIKGRIDRIDRNSRTGAVCVLDYKTTDKTKGPQETHFGSPREDDDLAEADIPAELVSGKKDKRWADLQLPLYRELVRSEFGSEVQLGYICLPKALGDTGFKLWESYNAELHGSAVGCAEAVIRQIKASVFWPPGRLKTGYNDDFAGVLPGDPEKSICQPPSPWRAGT